MLSKIFNRLLNLKWEEVVFFSLLFVGLLVVLQLNSQVLIKNQNKIDNLTTKINQKPEITKSPVVVKKVSKLLTEKEVEAIKSEVDSMEWIDFRSKILGIKFKYPREWGLVEESLSTTNSFVIHESYGIQYTLRFGNKDILYIQGSGYSYDFSPGRGVMETDFRGNKNDMNQKVVSYIDIGYPECILEGGGWNGHIDFYLKNQSVGGLRLIMKILSKDDEEKIKQKFNFENLEPGDCPTKDLANYEKLPQEIEKYIFESKSFDEESLENKFIFQKIAESARIN